MLEPVIEQLAQAPESINLASQMQFLLNTTKPSVSELLQMVPDIEAAIEAGEESINAVKQIQTRLTAAPAIPSKYAPLGF